MSFPLTHSLTPSPTVLLLYIFSLQQQSNQEQIMNCQTRETAHLTFYRKSSHQFVVRFFSWKVIAYLLFPRLNLAQLAVTIKKDASDRLGYYPLPPTPLYRPFFKKTCTTQITKRLVRWFWQSWSITHWNWTRTRQFRRNTKYPTGLQLQHGRRRIRQPNWTTTTTTTTRGKAKRRRKRRRRGITDWKSQEEGPRPSTSSWLDPYVVPMTRIMIHPYPWLFLAWVGIHFAVQATLSFR